MKHKLGCEKYSIDNCMLVKASVEEIGLIIKQYFGLNVYSNCHLEQYVNLDNVSWQEIERRRQVRETKPKKSFPSILWPLPIWQYDNQQWSLVPFSATEDSVAFALAILLETYTITFHDFNNVSIEEFKVFHTDKLIEHYRFGFECGQLPSDYWDINVVFDPYNDCSCEEHYFKSLVSRVTQSNMESALLAGKVNGKHDRGFLDARLKYYQAYIPLYEETPFYYRYDQQLDFQNFHSIVARMDIVILPSDWYYFDRDAPSLVT